MGCMVLPAQASVATGPGLSASARTAGGSIHLGMGELAPVTPSMNLSPKSSALATSSKMRVRLMLAVAVPPPKIPVAASMPPSMAEITANPAAVVRLARVTAYWPGEANGDYYTNCGLSSTGAHLHVGYCAVDPNVIPYGSVVSIAGLGRYLAVDTGSAVVSRLAARGAAKTPEEQKALVVDHFFANAADGEKFAASGPQYAAITWGATGVSDLIVDPQVLAAHRRFEEDTREMQAWVQSPGMANMNAFASAYP
jgi:3D (Asp-Asp-Asp) domain-containing protein